MLLVTHVTAFQPTSNFSCSCGVIFWGDSPHLKFASWVSLSDWELTYCSISDIHWPVSSAARKETIYGMKVLSDPECSVLGQKLCFVLVRHLRGNDEPAAGTGSLSWPSAVPAIMPFLPLSFLFLKCCFLGLFYRFTHYIQTIFSFSAFRWNV